MQYRQQIDTEAYNCIASFDVGLVLSMCYPKRSSSPYSNFVPTCINGVILWKSRSYFLKSL